MKLVPLLAMLGLLVSAPALARNQCSDPEDAAHFAERLTFKAAGKGRVYFHSGPDAACVDKKVFVIPGDELVANLVAGPGDAWVQVTYTDKNENDHTGWVRAEHLMFTGASGMNMTPAKAKQYKKAAAAAAAGKLGLP